MLSAEGDDVLCLLGRIRHTRMRSLNHRLELLLVCNLSSRIGMIALISRTRSRAPIGMRTRATIDCREFVLLSKQFARCIINRGQIKDFSLHKTLYSGFVLRKLRLVR